MRPSGLTPKESGGSKRIQPGFELSYHLLDLLVDGPSSYAALYGSLINNYRYIRDLDPERVLAVLNRLEEKGWVLARQMVESGGFRDVTLEDRILDADSYRNWLPTAELDELSVDEVGLWYEITEKGYDEWKKWRRTKP